VKFQISNFADSRTRDCIDRIKSDFNYSVIKNTTYNTDYSVFRHITSVVHCCRASLLATKYWISCFVECNYNEQIL